MSLYRYKGISTDGNLLRGTIEGTSERNIYNALKDNNIFLIYCRKILRLKFQNGVGINELCMFCKALLNLYKSGFDVIKIFHILGKSTGNKTMKKYITLLCKDIENGSTIAVSMKKYNHIFPNFMIEMISIGEQSGNLESALYNLCNYYEEEMKIKKLIRNAFAYPIFVIVVFIFLLQCIDWILIPALKNIFISASIDVPIALIKSMYMIKIFSIIIFLIFLSCIINFFIKKYFHKEIIFYRGAPLIKKIKKGLIQYRFFKFLSILLSSGINIVKALDIVSNINEDILNTDEIITSKEMLQNGCSISQSLSCMSITSDYMKYMIDLGAESGNLWEMIEEGCESLKDSYIKKISFISRIIEPLLIIIVGSFVCFILCKIIIPLLNSMQKLC